MTEKNYIGITGIRTIAEIDKIIELIDYFPEIKRHNKIMLGFLMKKDFALNKYAKNTSKRNITIPQAKALIGYLDDITISDEMIMKTLHISSDTPDVLFCKPLFSEIQGINAIQFNIHKIACNELSILKSMNPSIEFILQLKPKLLQNLSDYLISLSEYEKSQLRSSVDYFLIDSSEGKGIPLNENLVNNTIQTMNSHLFITNSFAFAGGLNAQRLLNHMELVKKYSFDAESGLRTDEQLDIVKIEDYFFNFSRIINGEI